MRMIIACLGRDWEVSPGLEKPMSPRVASGGRGMMKGRREEKGYYDQSGWPMKKRGRQREQWRGVPVDDEDGRRLTRCLPTTWGTQKDYDDEEYVQADKGSRIRVLG